jgi:hypothetical protein
MKSPRSNKIAVVKLTKSKKQLQFITDEGYVFATSVVFLQGLLMGKSKMGFVLLSRLPFNVSPDRFAPSPLYDPDGVFQGEAAKTLTLSTDALSPKAIKAKEVKKGFVDKKVWN